MPQLRANGLTFEYEVRGEGPPMLLIMGLGAQMIRWSEAFCDQLAARGFQVIRFDNRDVGLSQRLEVAGMPDLAAIFTATANGEKPSAAYDLSDMAADAVGVLDALGIERAHIVGASLGGMVAQLVAADYPERVLSLASIMSTTGALDLPPASPQALALFAAPAPDPNVNFQAFSDYGVYSARVLSSPAYPFDEAAIRTRIATEFERSYYPMGFWRQYAAVLASPHRRVKLAGVTAPSVVIHGADDPLVPLAAGEDTAAHVPGAQMVVIPGMGHEIPPGANEAIIDAIVGNAGRA